MIKVPARNKFSRKTSFQAKPDEIVGINRKVNRNRSSIMINGKTFQQYFQFAQSENIRSKDLGSNNFHNEKSSSTLQKYQESNFSKSSKVKKTFSIKQEEEQISLGTKSQTTNIKFREITNNMISRTQIHEEDESKSYRSINRSKSHTPQQRSLRNSALKKTNTKVKIIENGLARNSQTKKMSIFGNFRNTLGQQSQHYEEFLKESNLSEKKKEDQKDKRHFDKKHETVCKDDVSMKDSVKNEGTVRISISSKEERQTKIGSKACSTILKRSNSKVQRKTSHDQLKIPHFQQPTYKQLYLKSMTQNNITLKTDQPQFKPINQQQQQSNSNDQQSSTAQKQRQLQLSEQKRIQQQMIYKQQTEELFRKLQRQIASKEQLQRVEKNTNNFYEGLRVKLTKQYDEIARSYKLEEKEKDKIGLLIEGCNLERHRRVNNFYFEKKQFMSARPDTAGAIDQATKDINRLNFVSKQRNKTIMRPQTSRPRTTQRIRGKLSNQKSSHFLSDYNTAGYQTQRDFLTITHNKTLNKLSEDDFIFSMTNPVLRNSKQSQLNLSHDQIRDTTTNRPSSAVRPSTSKKTQKQLIKQKKQQLVTKFDTLLNLCDDQNQEHQTTKKKMRVFQYYCEKMDNGFEKLSQKIKDYVAKL